MPRLYENENLFLVDTKTVARGTHIVQFFTGEERLHREPTTRIRIMGLRAVVLSGVSHENFYLTLAEGEKDLLSEIPFASLPSGEKGFFVFAVPLEIEDRLDVLVRSEARSEEPVRLTLYGITKRLVSEVEI